MNKNILLLLMLFIFASCNAQLTGEIVDQSEFASNSSEAISDIKITKSNNEFMLDIDYVDHDNRYRNEKSVISLYKSDNLKGLRRSFTSLGYAYSGELHCLNMDCSNADFDVSFDRNQESSKPIKIAKREYPISTSSIKFYPNDNQSKGDVLFDAQMIQKSMQPELTLSLIQIQGVKVPLIQIGSTSTLDKTNTARLSFKSNGIDSSITVVSGASADFKVVNYKNDRTGAVSMTLQNYNGSIVIDTYR